MDSDAIGSAGTGADPHERVSRRVLLIGGAATLSGAGIGVVIGFGRPDRSPTTSAPPRALVRALAAERHLIDVVTASGARDPELATSLVQVRRDHAAHAQALVAALAERGLSPTTAARPGPTSHGLDRAALRAMERTAATLSAGLAEALTGQDAVLLASISACEATHAELLS